MMTVSTRQAEPKKNLPALGALLLAAAIATFLLIVAGNIVRVSGSELGCPDWPTCYGQWTVPGSLNGQIQYAHRALALLSAVLVLAAGAAAFWQRPARLVKGALVGAIGLMGVEILIGARFVSLQDPAALNTLHLGLALGVLAFLIVALVATFYRAVDPDSPGRMAWRTRFGRQALLALAAIFLVMLSGVFLVSLDSPSVCLGWPLCGGNPLPVNLVGWVEIAHRLLTLLAAISVTGLLLSAWRSQRSQRVALSAATATAILYFGQVLVGALKVARGYPLDLIGLHAVTASGLWAAVVLLVTAAGLSGRSAADEAAEASQPIDIRERARDLLILTKPVIVLAAPGDYLRGDGRRRAGTAGAQPDLVDPPRRRPGCRWFQRH